MRRRGLIATVLIATVLLILLRRIGNFLVDLLWFSTVGLLFLVVFASSTALGNRSSRKFGMPSP